MTNIVQQNNFPHSLNPLKKSENLPPPLQVPLQTRTEVNNLDYRFEAIRLKSFQNWPVSFIEPRILAAAGFYYMGKTDRVKCFECETEIYKWEKGDIPMIDHERSSPNCRFVRNIPCGNVPIDVDSASVILPSPRSQDVCGIHDTEMLPEPDQKYMEQDFSHNKLRSLGLERPRPPAYPKYVNLESRLRTFDTWPKSLPPYKEELADAGFFYTGREDQTLCFHCGGGLKDWEPEDDPWDQHSKWFSKCYYLLVVKGEEYVNTVTQQCVVSSSRKETLNLKLPSYIQKIGHTSMQIEQPQEEISEKTNLKNNPGYSVNSSNSNTENSSSTSCSFTTENKHDLYNKNEDKYKGDGRLCKICYNAEMSIVFLPCKHMISCGNCASVLDKCPICRKSIDLIITAILS
ncbi:E3 ubiquitin-protein ligase XIAP-like isoform X1 [Vespula pensylvanica]|uniref:RING-type domain-containing protein n=2 Tax=Vespula pensylvanica TaxID=30213 RepID=A0A834U9X4_VESPE|nr:E3 ubiquitin-protein ligase XIAP-like isoform X1 [Vespula pensylvanica]KAF7425082.1 hypothetical protein H0235_007520 [Vespula pensylvanica]